MLEFLPVSADTHKDKSIDYVLIIDLIMDNNSTFSPLGRWTTMTSSTQMLKNACEFFHNNYNSNFVFFHLNKLKFLNILKSPQNDTKILIQSCYVKCKILR